MSIVGTRGLEALTGGLPLDAVGMVRRVGQRVVGQLMSEGLLSDDAGASPEEVIATALGNWLTRTLRNEQSPIPTLGETAPELALGAVDLTGSAERNSLLAAALGACDCWGDDPSCPFCDGSGTSGWMPPDRQLFADLVEPAITALNSRRHYPPPTSPTTNHHRGDNR
jgi:hypothetical protein